MNVYLAELIGTAVLIFLGCGVNAGVSLTGSYSNSSGWIVIAIGWGLAVSFAIYAVGSVSGAHINPAVTLGLASIGEFPWNKVPGYVISQLLGAMIGAFWVWLLYIPHWSKTEDPDTKLGVFSTSPAIKSTYANLLSETIGTFILLFALMFIGTNNFTQGLNPLVVGLLIVTIGVSVGGVTGYAINPARDFGPRLTHFLLPIAGKRDSNWSYSWIPVVGPALGGISGALAYMALFNNSFTLLFWIILLINLCLVIATIIEQKSTLRDHDLRKFENE